MKTQLFFIALLGSIFFACNNNEPAPDNISVNLQFSHLVDNAPVQLDQLIYKNALDQEFSIKTVKYFISGFTIHKNDGTVISFDDIHYVDIRTSETLSYTLSKKIAPGDYAGISFVHGLAKDNNITGQFAEPPESLMDWPMMMGGGYHYMKLEGEFKTASTENFFNFHSGALDGINYEVDIDLSDQPFSVTKALNIELSMEIQNWFTNPTDWDFTYFGPAIMADHEAQTTVQANGRDVYSFTLVNNIK